MITSFRPLCTLAMAHAYYSTQACRDFDFLVPVDTAATLRNRRLLAKKRDGVLHVLFETDTEGAPLIPLAGLTLRFGLQLLNPLFDNITAPLPLAALPLYRNAATPGSLDPATGVVMTGRLLCHPLTRTARPVTVSIHNPAGQPLQTENLTAEHHRDTVSANLTGQAAGAYRVEESYPDQTATISYYLDPELQRAGLFAMVELTIASDFPASPPPFLISFAARQERLNYYLVASNYTPGEMTNLAVADKGFAEEGRPQIHFERVEPPAFTAEEIPVAMLAKPGQQVVLYKSQGMVARREQARRKIELSKNGDVLIKHLPQVGAASGNGDVVIHISKP
jgi:hypothetical protein